LAVENHTTGHVEHRPVRSLGFAIRRWFVCFSALSSYAGAFTE
jgi:hypothetical protein